MTKQHFKTCWWGIVLASALVLPAHALQIVVSIPVLAKIATALAAPDDRVETLIKQPHSPHYYSLKPSHLRSLKQADLIVWIAPQLDPFVGKAVTALELESKSLMLLDTPDLRLIYLEKHHSHDHDHGHDHDDHAEHSPALTQPPDPHIWLSPDNAIAMARYLKLQLVRLQPSHQQHYEARFKQFVRTIKQADAEIKARLAGKSPRYLLHHDSLMYFERHYGLRNQGSFTLPSGQIQGTATLTKIKQTLNRRGVDCAYLESSMDRQALLNWLDENDVHLFELDPLGFRLSPKQGYADLLVAIGSQLARCTPQE